jgi:class III poly(R)-hydroxyalkanoic acid synthase PhaE subunit
MIDGLKNDWMDQWQALSRQYWNAWQDLARDAGTSAAAGRATMPPWHEGFEQWSRMFGGAGRQSETIERVLASARSFTQFAEAMVAAATAGNAGAMPNWADVFRNFSMPGGMPGMGDAFANPLAGALGEISGQGVRSFEQLMKNFTPGAFGAGFDPMREAKSWLRVPAFGFLREHQEHYQKMALAFVDYQEQNARYNALILKASQRGFGLFESKLAAREEPGRQIDSLRALYDLWVDAMEEAYAEIALSPEFRDVYGSLVNAQMRVRSEIQQEIERIATDFGMPTRSELDSIGQRLHDLRREVRKAPRAGGSEDLRCEVDRLKREVAALKAALEARPSAQGSATSKPTPAKAARRSRARPAKKRAAQSVALRADIEETVSAAPAAAPKVVAKKTSPTPRTPAKTRAPSRAKRPLPPRAKKKSVAKIAHSPVRIGHPVASFAERMAAFAKTAHRHTNARRGGR